MKILFTSVGRRVELVQAFFEAAKKINEKLEIIGLDASDSAPALSFCSKRVLSPRISDADYIPFLKEICKKEKVDVLIPTIDTDLLILSKYKDDFGSTKVLVSDFDKIQICRDKRKVSSFFDGLNLLSPKTFDSFKNYCCGFPAFIKPKDGSSSIFAYKVNNEEELVTMCERVPEYIIQPFIDGVEYTVDAFCDFNGNPIFITPRIRLAVRSGEVLKTQISQDLTIIEETKKIIKKFKPCGQITIQLIREKSTGKDYFIEINPRFGGGAPLSIKAGADSAEMLLRLVRGEMINYIQNAATDGAIYSRFDQSIRVN